MKKYLTEAKILLPKSNFDKWSVIACDQYTSEPEYWEETKANVKDSPSALNIILPEVYLKPDNTAEINAINQKMNEYLENGVFNTYENTIVYVERALKDGKVRNGLVGLIDLEDYSFEKGAKTAVRATEATVLERIPPRVKIRKDASLELPHVMLLIDDPDLTVIEPLNTAKDEMEILYDFELMQNAGHIKGYKLSEKAVEAVNVALDKLKVKSQDGLLFAVGDGNHSLATAKACYENENGSRYALVEVVNIHDLSLEFEPIYRVLFNVNPENVIEEFLKWTADGDQNNLQSFTFCYNGKEETIKVKSKGALCVATLQVFIDEYLKQNKSAVVDYIHGIESTKKLAQSENSLGINFDGMEKSELFKAVSLDGSLPRKTFSMGCADDKRFYLEARKIKD